MSYDSRSSLPPGTGFESGISAHDAVTEPHGPELQIVKIPLDTLFNLPGGFLDDPRKELLASVVGPSDQDREFIDMCRHYGFDDKTISIALSMPEDKRGLFLQTVDLGNDPDVRED